MSSESQMVQGWPAALQPGDYVVHIHHGISPNAGMWAQFCQDLCRRLGDLKIELHRRHPEHRLLYMTGLAFGMGLTNYQVLLLLGASLALVILVKNLSLFRDFMLVGLPFILVFVMLLAAVIVASACWHLASYMDAAMSSFELRRTIRSVAQWISAGALLAFSRERPHAVRWDREALAHELRFAKGGTTQGLIGRLTVLSGRTERRIDRVRR